MLFPLDLDASLHGLVLASYSSQIRETAAKERLDEFLRSAGAPQAHPAILTGDAGLQIADYAKRVNADLIIVPSHGYHGVKRLLLGSTAERVIRHANCSVLVLRRKDAE